MIARLLDAILGPRCNLCSARIFVADREIHMYVDHWGEGRAS